MISYSKTPIQALRSKLLDQHGLRVLVKREDLNHPLVSGNKWWKLKYNLEAAARLSHRTILTFGGAYSNHIFATAAAAKALGLKSIGITRGERTLPLNHTLAFAEACGMKLHHITREAYRKKNEAAFIEHLDHQFGDFYLIPEGGTNELAVKGCAEFASRLSQEVEFDCLCLSIGTGGTMAGMIQGLEATKKVIGFPALKGGEFLKSEIQRMISPEKSNWWLETNYHFGGYGKVPAELKTFVAEVEENYQLPLDIVYTGKMFYGVLDLITKGYFIRGSTVLVLHTGGLQKNFNTHETV